ncbi:MAG: TonB-dependent receptor plug domain-containing protein, partial [Bacteroidia bacterium]|nr:TonB-dependent receptor plug domain-containing protein [Bacteroidia bacterium]
MRFLYSCLCILIGVICLASVQAQSIGGQVRDAHSGKILAGATIQLLNTSRGTNSLNDGSFNILRLNPDAYQLRVSMIGYETHEQRIEVSGDSLGLEISLEPQIIALNKEIIVSAQRSESASLRRPEAVSVLSGQQLRQYAPRSTPEALIGTTGVWMQKTNHGSGSPFIRGLTGNQTLLVVDGIRLNNATFRYGPNQYLNTVSPLSLAQIEVIRGAGSVAYGSDALGGVVHLRTRSPQFSESQSRLVGSLYAKYMNEDMEQSTRAELEWGSRRWAILSGISLHHFGDLVAGGDLGTQAPSAYTEVAGDIKIRGRIGQNQIFTVAYQHVHQRDVPRYDQVAQRGFQIYEFDPQARQLGYLRWETFST